MSKKKKETKKEKGLKRMITGKMSYKSGSPLKKLLSSSKKTIVKVG